MSSDKDYEWLITLQKSAYELLSLPTPSPQSSQPSFSQSKLRKQYRAKALELHPDKNKSPNADEEFREISVSLKILSDPSLKQKYDEYLQRKLNAELQKKARGAHQQQIRDDLVAAEESHLAQQQQKLSRDQKIIFLRKKYLKLKKHKTQEILNSRRRVITIPDEEDNNDQDIQELCSFPFEPKVRVKWKYKQQVGASISEDVIARLMEVFGKVERVDMSRGNTETENYHYATVTFQKHISCIVAQLHDYDHSSSLWDEVGLSRISKLLRSAKIVRYDSSIKLSGYKDMPFEEYLGISLLTLDRTINGRGRKTHEKHRKHNG
ncbi:unnamed protein product [Ambrosiozyma monospora]|uniref:Unnamed protein product n=1 Tax=Ambrosiozyma monospora TaxID=43982 RepID=A0A9W7DF19_AMBMO|nr:unnamed protein product [Ambrosiozyma monospora]